MQWVSAGSATDPCCCGGCPDTSKTLRLTFSGVIACPGYLGAIPSGSYDLTYSSGRHRYGAIATLVISFTCSMESGSGKYQVSADQRDFYGGDPSDPYNYGPMNLLFLNGPTPTSSTSDSNQYTDCTFPAAKDGTVTWEVLP